MEIKKRIHWLDICKGILIMTIVLMHIEFPFWKSNDIGKYLDNLTSLYKVSIFFCIAGFTISEEKLLKSISYMKHKVKSVYSKIIIISIPIVLLHNFFIKIDFYRVGTNYAGKTLYYYSNIDFIKQIILTFLFAGREVMIGPMWFVNVLFIALCIEAVLAGVINSLFKASKCKRNIRLIICLSLMVFSSILTNMFGITIPRANNTLTAVFLIDLGQYIFRNKKVKFDNKFMFLGSLIILLNLPLYGYLSLNQNYYVSPSYLIMVVLTSMYVLCFLCKKIERLCFSNILEYIGKRSFYIMGFQFLSFKIGTVVLNKINILFGVDSSKILYGLTPTADTIGLLLYYFLCGIIISCFFGEVIEKIIAYIKLKKMKAEDYTI
ncbi:MAG: acyltransferase family protein [Clostridium baratii]